jgi:hypothetical protein
VAYESVFGEERIRYTVETVADYKEIVDDEYPIFLT